jgi:hypothetical protein
MRSGLLQLLTCAMAVPLVLPPDWCCALRAMAPSPARPAVAVAEEDCPECGCCGRKKPPAPAPTPAPRKCEVCAQRDLTAPASPELPQPAAATGLLPVTPDDRPAAHPFAGGEPAVAARAGPLHVLHCVWRC